MGTMRSWFIFLIAVINCSPACGMDRGYAMSFQGLNPMAAPKQRFDMSDPGFRDIKGSLTIMGWFKYSQGVRVSPAFNIQTYTDYFDFSAIDAFLFIENYKTHMLFTRQANFVWEETWRHYALVFDEGRFRTYLDGVLQDSNYVYGEFANFTLEGARLMFGTHLNENGAQNYPEAPSYDHPGSKQHPSFVGKIDDFSIYSTALSGAQIINAMKKPQDTSNIPANLVIYYNFDIGSCHDDQGADFLTQGSCEVLDGVVKNHGVSGPGYDLVLGQFENSDYGKHYVIRESIDYASTHHRFEEPTISIETPPIFNDVDKNTRIPTVVQLGFEGNTTVRLPEGSVKLVSVPLVGLVRRGSNGVVLEPEDDISSESYLVVVSGTYVDFTRPFYFKISLLGDLEHQIHMWPFLQPSLSGPLKEQIEPIVIMLERQQKKFLQMKQFFVSPTGQDLNALIARHSDLFSVKNVILDTSQSIVEEIHKGENINGSLTIQIEANDELGYGEITVNFWTNSLGTTRTVGISVVVYEADQKPTVSTLEGAVTMLEDSNGTIIKLQGSVENPLYGFFFVVSTLPQHGKLFKRLKQEGTNEWVLIDKPYNVFDAGTPFGQYVDQVTNVSSFEVYLGLKLEYHPIHVIGPPTCPQIGQNNCDNGYLNSKDPTSMHNDIVGALVYVDLYHSELQQYVDHSLRVPGRIVSVYGDKKNIIDVEVLPQYKYIDGNPVECYGSMYSIDCNEDIVPKKRPFMIRGIPRNSTMLGEIKNRGWSPGRLWDTEVHGGETYFINTPPDFISGRFGPQYRFQFNSTFPYFLDDSMLFTDFIEVTFEKHVYPVSVVLSYALGGGGLVRIYAERPDKTLQVLYQNKPQVEKYKEYERKNQKFEFDQAICRPNFKTNKLRLEFNARERDGTGWFLLESIMLSGSSEIQPGVVGLEEDELLYVPNRDAYGRDEFSFQASDCGGKVSRVSNTALVTVDIRQIQDAPVFKIQDQKWIAVCNGTTGKVTMPLHALDVDDDLLKLVVLEVPEYGKLYQGGQRLETGDVTSFQNHSVILEYRTELCFDQRYMGGFDNFIVQAQDPYRGVANKTVRVKILKEFKKLASISKLLATIMFGVNVFTVTLCFMWMMLFSNHPVVQATQRGFLLLVLFGALVSSSTLLTLTVDDGIDGENKRNADLSCMLMPWLYTFGFMTTYVPLYAKLYKVSRLFEVDFLFRYAAARGDEKKKLEDSISTAGLLKRLSIVWLIELGIVFAWTVIGPLTFKRFDIRKDEDMPNFVVESVGYCTSGIYDVRFISLIAVYHILILVHVTHYCYKTMHINDAYSEAKYLRIALASSLQIMLFSIPIMLITSSSPDPDTTTFLRAGVIWVNDISILLFIFLPKMKMVHSGAVAEGGAGYDQILASCQAANAKQHSKVSNSRTVNGSTTQTATSVLNDSTSGPTA